MRPRPPPDISAAGTGVSIRLPTTPLQLSTAPPAVVLNQVAPSQQPGSAAAIILNSTPRPAVPIAPQQQLPMNISAAALPNNNSSSAFIAPQQHQVRHSIQPTTAHLPLTPTTVQESTTVSTTSSTQSMNRTIFTPYIGIVGSTTVSVARPKEEVGTTLLLPYWLKCL